MQVVFPVDPLHAFCLSVCLTCSKDASNWQGSILRASVQSGVCSVSPATLRRVYPSPWASCSSRSGLLGWRDGPGAFELRPKPQTAVLDALPATKDLVRMLKGAGMENVRRVLVHLSKENSRPQRARFQQSIVGHFCGASKDSLMVNCGLSQHQFLISDMEFAGSSQVLLQRPPFCPIKHLSDAQAASLTVETRDRGVDVGVAILLQSACQKVLLTRRSKNLSIFPNLWVPPGGHVEPGEQLLDAGLRELREETGLCLQGGEFSWHTLALWESVYPPMLSRGLPKRHHVVVYLLLLSPESHQQLQMRFKPDEAEVSAYTWLERQVLASVAATEDGVGDAKNIADDLPPAIRITELQHGSAKTTTIPTVTFLNTAPPQGEDVERVSTGTKFALRLWLDTLALQAE